METTQEAPAQDVRERLTLRDAVRLSGMSEKTLRRKLEAGLLSGHRETLDYGGFMWMIDARSLAELYPDSAAVRDYVQYLESTLQNSPITPPATDPEVPASTQLAEMGEEEDEPVTPARNDFILYLLEENRGLKDDLRDRERQVRSLQDRALNLERECGEQRGTAATQARVLEWFQRQPQPGQLALPSGDADPGPQQVPTPLTATPKNWTVVLAMVTLLLSLAALLKTF